MAFASGFVANDSHDCGPSNLKMCPTYRADLSKVWRCELVDLTKPDLPAPAGAPLTIRTPVPNSTAPGALDDCAQIVRDAEDFSVTSPRSTVVAWLLIPVFATLLLATESTTGPTYEPLPRIKCRVIFARCE